MSSHRPERVAEAIREVVATAILSEVSDPRVKGVTVIRVEVSADLRQAVVLVSVMGDAREQKLAMRGLASATGYLQSKVAARLQIRYAPTVRFKLDEGVKKSVLMSKLIDEALAKSGDPVAEPELSESPPKAIESSGQADS